MQLVLLSGGSGKRLWPLSNNARSKQFLSILEKSDGTYESMVQRVVRQAKEVILTTDITIATNVCQLDIITNQLGDNVSVVTEPERRDTFPAIALVTSFLSLSKNCSDDEVVVIMPCDPYTEIGYFEAICRMVDCVKQNIAELILMGITPTYPSEKYGYVVPEVTYSNSKPITEYGQLVLGTDYHRVARFTEKPTTIVAEELLKQNAYWNGGVFAFRLGYMMNIVRKYIISESFEEIRARYSEFPKISFDYEVVEKAESVAVVPYSGKWKDLGTWNTLTDELKQHTIGNAILGPLCENTHVINELQNPIFVDGLKDVIVTACPDGILVCAKKDTENIKKYIDRFTSRPMYEVKRWGSFRILDNSINADGNHSMTKSITLKEGKNISYHIHYHRSETWIFTQGEGIFVLDGVEKHVKVGDSVHIPVEHYHALKALTELSYIEVQCGNPLIEEDIERFEWEWK